MTQNSAFKASVRARMDATGETYNVARRKILAERASGTEQQLPELLRVDPLPDPNPAATEAWRSVHWSAPLGSYYDDRSVAGQEGDVDV